jgi:hypothetical protein
MILIVLLILPADDVPAPKIRIRIMSKSKMERGDFLLCSSLN